MIPKEKLIKHKRDDTIKDRTCVNSEPQQKYIPREEASSSTVGLKLLIIMLIIDTQEEQDITMLM